MELAAIIYQYDEGGDVIVAALVADGRASGPYFYSVRYIGGAESDVTRHFYGLLTGHGMHVERVAVEDVDYLAREVVWSAPWTVFEHVGGVWREAVTA